MNRKLNVAAIGLGFALFLIPQFSQAAEWDHGDRWDRGREDKFDRFSQAAEWDHGDRWDRGREDKFDRGRDNDFDHGGSFHDKCEKINIRYDEHDRDRDRDRGRDRDRDHHHEHCQVVSPNRPW